MLALAVLGCSALAAPSVVVSVPERDAGRARRRRRPLDRPALLLPQVGVAVLPPACCLVRNAAAPGTTARVVLHIL
jgi:hypothetical protein